MISAWSRTRYSAATTQCLSCASAPAVAARPSFKQVLQRLQYKHLTILFYSTVIATAAAVDVRNKRQRKDQWTKVIAETERSMREQDAALAPQLSLFPDRPPHKAGEGSTSGIFRSLTSAEHQPSVSSIPDYSIFQTLRILNVLPYEQRVQAEVRRSLDVDSETPLVSRELARVSPNSIYASSRRKNQRKSTWTPKKQTLFEYSVLNLCMRLLHEAAQHARELDQENAWASREEALNLISGKLKESHELMRTVSLGDTWNLNGIDPPEYPRYKLDLADEDRKHHTGKLINELRFRCQQYRSGHISYSTFLAEVSQTLLLSEVPPSREVYTLLINRFSRLRLSHVVNMFIEGMFRGLVRPDEMTISAIFSHYINSQNAVAFHRFLLRVRDNHFGGISIAKPGTKLDGVAANRLVKWDGKIQQGISLDPVTWNLAIRGCLKFGSRESSLKSAHRTLRKMQEDGVQPNLVTLNLFLRWARQYKSWHYALGLWEIIETRYLSRFKPTELDAREERYAFYNMLELCKAQEEHEHFNRIEAMAIQRGHESKALTESSRCTRAFSAKEDKLQVQRRKLNILERRLQLMIDDLAQWTIQVHASRAVLTQFHRPRVTAPRLVRYPQSITRQWPAERRVAGKSLIEESLLQSLLTQTNTEGSFG